MELARHPASLLLVHRHEAGREGRELVLSLCEARSEVVDHPGARRSRHHAGDEGAHREPEGRRGQAVRGRDGADQREARTHEHPRENRPPGAPREQHRTPDQETGQQVRDDRWVRRRRVRLEVDVDQQIGRDGQHEDEAQRLGVARTERAVGEDQQGGPQGRGDAIEGHDLQQRRGLQIVGLERQEQQGGQGEQGGDPELRPRREIGAVALVRHSAALWPSAAERKYRPLPEKP